MAILAALVVGLFMTTPTDGDFWWYDSSRHAMNGVFIRDFLLEGGLRHPIRFASAYYQQYPAINIGFYPPLFYITSAPFLAVFGASHAVSQAVVHLYALAAGILAYLFCVRVMERDRLSALAVAVAILALPGIALWTRQVQSDIPAITLLLATAYCLLRHLERGERNWLFAATISLGLAILTRAQAIYAMPPLLYFLFLHAYPNRPSWKLRMVALIPMALLALPSVAMVAYFSRVNQSQALAMPGMPTPGSLDNWTWYAEALPEQMGWPALAVVIAGLRAAVFLAARRRMTLAGAIAAAFCLCSWILFSIVSNKEPRFNLPSLPFLFLLSAFGLYLLLPRLARLALPVLAVWLAFQALAATQVPLVAGFKEAALAAQAATPQGGNVLIAAHRDGSFIFDMRTYGKRRDIGIRRADKLLVDISIRREFGVKDKGLDQAALADLMKREKIAAVVVQEGYLSDQPTMRALYQLLESGQHYRLAKTIAMTGETRQDEKRLLLFEAR
jgi:hypothetical protein